MLHAGIHPYFLHRLKRDAEEELLSKFEHLTMCPLSKRQRFLYDEIMGSGVYQKIANNPTTTARRLTCTPSA